MPESTQTSPGDWYLEGYSPQGEIWVIHIRSFPFRVGRLEGSDLRLSSQDISRRHAELFAAGQQIGVRELGSTNGTFVNRERVVGERILQDGDILNFGYQEFRVSKKPTDSNRALAEEGETQCFARPELPKGLFGYAEEFEQMLQSKAVQPHYQPLCRLDDLQIFGYELLGRGKFPNLPESPGPLFEIAKALNRAVELSSLFRHLGLAKASEEAGDSAIYFNTLPEEMNMDFLRGELSRLKTLAPQLPLVMEIHEGAVTNTEFMHELRALLRELEIQLAYDDFGAGYARLQELMDVPPDVLKFDIALIRSIHRRPPRSRQVIQTLVRMAKNLGIKTLAEGIEEPEELAVCREIGFDYAQGYLLGKPEPTFRKAPRIQA